MKKVITAFTVLGLMAGTAYGAGEDSIQARKAAMKAVGKATKAKDFAALNKAAMAAQAAFKTDTTGNLAMETESSDKIWSDSAGFNKLMGDLVTLSAAGDPNATKTCKACHSEYRVKR